MDAAEILTGYRRALGYSKTYLGMFGVDHDQRINSGLIAADEKVRENGLDGTPEYVEAVRLAEQDANAFLAQIFSGVNFSKLDV
jgi:hypothetical protein